MLSVHPSTPSPDSHFPSTLADLSRNASVISTSSSDSVPSLSLQRPRPIRAFTSPRSKSPQSPSPRAAPAYLTKELGLSGGLDISALEQRAATARARSLARSKSRNPPSNAHVDARDFEFGETLGEGSYSTVVRAKHIANGREYAVKILDKGHLQRHRKLPIALAEKNALVRLGSGHPGVIRLFWTFHDEWSLFFVLDLAKNGEMQSRISQLGSLSIPCAQYYAAQIVDAVDYMHSKDVIHRDLKPENLLLDDAFRIKITDFGTGRYLEPGEDRAKTFVGTAQYVSPELLEASETSKSSDLWAVGCIIYQMIAGRFAFQGLSEYLTWQKIKQLEFSFPEGFDEQAKDLVKSLLVRDPAERLGAGAPGTAHDMRGLRSHPFFSTIDWTTLWTGPAPHLESGLFKRASHTLAGANDRGWEDVGAAWDELVAREEAVDTDEIDWALDGERPVHEVRRPNGQDSFVRNQEVGPIPRFAIGDAEEDTETILGLSHEEMAVAPIDVPSNALRGTASGSSSSDGSPTEQLGAALEAMTLDRGRTRMQTPIQGNFTCNPADCSSFLLPGELVIYSSRVESRSLRRRASMLLSSMAPIKQKPRQLILTSLRILCLKSQYKGRGGGVGIRVKTEIFLREPEKTDKLKDGEVRPVFLSVEPKGDKEFVVLTTGKSHSYSGDTAAVTAIWIQKINDASATISPIASSDLGIQQTPLI